MDMNDDQTLYELVGGMSWFHELCERFYRRVADDELLRPLYPDDLEPSRYWLALFLAQYWGGPTDYSENRGTPGYGCDMHTFVSERLSETVGTNI